MADNPLLSSSGRTDRWGSCIWCLYRRLVLRSAQRSGESRRSVRQCPLSCTGRSRCHLRDFLGDEQRHKPDKMRKNKTKTAYILGAPGSFQTVRLMSGLTKHHLWPQRIALRLQTESANAILPSDFKPSGQTEFNLLLLCRGQLGPNGKKSF